MFPENTIFIKDRTGCVLDIKSLFLKDRTEDKEKDVLTNETFLA